MYFPNLLELSFRNVLAFPNACGRSRVWEFKSRWGSLSSPAFRGSPSTIETNSLERPLPQAPLFSPATSVGFRESHPWSSWYLQDRIGEEQAIPDNLQLLCGRTGHGEELEDLLGGFRLPGSAFSRDQDEVVVVLGAHETVGVVGNGVAGEEARRTE